MKKKPKFRVKPMTENVAVIEKILAGHNIFISGPGGVGKSFLLRNLKDYFRGERLVFLTASTGIAAINIGGTTLHRFAGIGLGQGTAQQLLIKVRDSGFAKRRWREADILVIDEISMIGAKLFDKLDFIARKVRGIKRPFGGLQLVVVGDMLQLPPVKDDFVFESEAWSTLNFQPVILEIPYRYTDIKFFELLQRVRNGTPTNEDLEILEDRVIDPPSSDILPTKLYARRIDVKYENNEMLEKLPGPEHRYTAIDTAIQIKGKERVPISAKQYEFLLDQIAPSTIIFKKGAQVMLTFNLGDADNVLFANGSRGVVLECQPTGVKVRFKNGEEVVVDYVDRSIEEQDVIISRRQIPLVHAWALTIHKCQASTLDFCYGDLGTKIFEDGQAYVLLSRVRSLDGLFLTNFYPKSIRANKKAIAFMESIQKKE